MRRTICAAASAVAAALASTGTADADVRVFKATAEGSGTYERADAAWDPFGDPLFQEAVEASFAWRVTIPRIVFDSRGELLPGTGPADGAISGTGTHDYVLFGRAGDQIIRNPGACATTGQPRPVTGAAIAPDPTPPQGGEEGTDVLLRPFDALALPATCTGGLVNLHDVAIWKGNDPSGAFDQRFTLPRLAVEQGKIIQHTGPTPAQKAACARRSQWTQSCTLDWSGKVTFELVEVLDTDRPDAPGDLLPPLPPSPPPPPSPHGEDDLLLPVVPPARDPDEDLLLPVDGTVAGDGSRATITVTSTAGGTGTVRAFGLGATAAARVPGRPLAAHRFTARPGRPVRVTLRFRGRARRAVRRGGGVRVTVAIGRQTRRSLVLRIRRR